jgi:endonuclease G, mitochondrial
MKKSRFGIVTKTLLAFTAALLVLSISMTTATMTPLSEGFEAGGKTAYAAANVALGTGSWFMDDALTGNLSTDRKTGLWSSTNNGSTWTQVGSTVTTSSTTLQTATFTVNNANAIRFEIRKVSGGANRINIDTKPGSIELLKRR